MNSLKNSVRLVGHLGNNPEVKEIASGKKVAKISLATNESYKKNSGELVTETQWHNLVAWGKTAEIAEKFLQKGKRFASKVGSITEVGKMLKVKNVMQPKLLSTNC